MDKTTVAERQPLVVNDAFEYGALEEPVSGDDPKRKARHSRAATLGAFRVVDDLGVPPALEDLPPGSRRHRAKSHSVSGDGMPSYLTAVELGQRELYTQVPFAAVFGLQSRERAVREAFAEFAGTATVRAESQAHPEWNDRHRRQASLQASSMILDQLDKADLPDPKRLTWSFILAVAVATASQFSVGYNTGVMNAPEKVVFPGHSTGLWSFAVAAFAIGGPFGAIVGGRLADSKGRRGALLIDVCIFLIGGLLQMLARDLYMIAMARFFIGFASGFSSVLVPIYLGEVAPPRLRGTLGTLTQFAMVIGIFVADLLAFPFATPTQWRLLFAVTPLVALFQILASPYLLESPRWLLNQDPKSTQAREIVKQLRGLHEEHDIAQEVANYLLGEAAQHQDDQKSQGEIIAEMWSHPKIRVLLVSSLFLQMSQQFSGINAVFYYSTSFFEGVIDNPLVGTTIVGGVNVLATYVALLLMDSSGRKTLLLWSSGGMFLSCVVIVLSLKGYLSNIFALIAVNVYVSFFEIGLGPIPWLIVAEMFPAAYIATAMSLCSQLNWACNFIVGLVFPYLNEYLGAYSFGPFAIILALAFTYSLLVLPETQGTTPEALIAEMERHNSQVVYETDPLVMTSSNKNGAWDRDGRKVRDEED